MTWIRFAPGLRPMLKGDRSEAGRKAAQARWGNRNADAATSKPTTGKPDIGGSDGPSPEVQEKRKAAAAKAAATRKANREAAAAVEAKASGAPAREGYEPVDAAERARHEEMNRQIAEMDAKRQPGTEFAGGFREMGLSEVSDGFLSQFDKDELVDPEGRFKTVEQRDALRQIILSNSMSRHFKGPDGIVVSCYDKGADLSNDQLNGLFTNVKRLHDQAPLPDAEIVVGDGWFKGMGYGSGVGGAASLPVGAPAQFDPSIHLRPDSVTRGYFTASGEHFMPAFTKEPTMYALAHEWGHAVDSRPSRSAMMDFQTQQSAHLRASQALRDSRAKGGVERAVAVRDFRTMGLSKYARTGDNEGDLGREAWAESFTLWMSSKGKVPEGSATAVLADKYGWQWGKPIGRFDAGRAASSMDKAADAARYWIVDTFDPEDGADGFEDEGIDQLGMWLAVQPVAKSVTVRFAPGLVPVLKMTRSEAGAHAANARWGNRSDSPPKITVQTVFNAFEGTYTTGSGLEFKLVSRSSSGEGGGPITVNGEILVGDAVVGKWVRKVNGTTMYAEALNVGKDFQGNPLPGAEQFQGKGIALEVQKQTEKAARELGCTEIRVSAMSDGVAAWAQERFGYRFEEKPSLRSTSKAGREPRDDGERAIPLGGVGYPSGSREYRGEDGLMYGFSHPDLGVPSVRLALADIEQRFKSNDPDDWPSPAEVVSLGTGRRVTDDIIEGRTLGEHLLSRGWSGVKSADHVTKAVGGLMRVVVEGVEILKAMSPSEAGKLAANVRWGNRGPDPRGVPPELHDAFDYATGYKTEFTTGAQQSVAMKHLERAALAHAVSIGMSDEDIPYDEFTEANIYAHAMLRKAYDRIDQDERFKERSDEDSEALAEVMDDWRFGGQVMVKVPSEYLDDIIDDGVRNQFDTEQSNGLYHPDTRAIAETAAHGLHPSAMAAERPIYGFVGMPGSEHPDALGQYGDVTLVLKRSVRDRTTVTLGDSLNTKATPVPIDGTASIRELSDAAGRTMFMDTGAMAVGRGRRVLDSGSMFMEAQVMGTVRLDDIDRIVFDGRDPHLQRGGIELLRQELQGRGVAVDVFEG